MCIRDSFKILGLRVTLGASMEAMKAAVFVRFQIFSRIVLAPGWVVQRFMLSALAAVLVFKGAGNNQSIIFHFAIPKAERREHLGHRVLARVGNGMDAPAVGVVPVSYTHLDVYKRQL